MTSRRLFFALDINAQDKSAIEKWCQQQTFDPQAPTKLKLIKAANFHITLAFLGQVTKTDELVLIKKAECYYQKTQQLQQFIINACSIGLFKKPQVLYLSFNDFHQPLINLANHLSEQALSMGLFQEQRQYLPHLSIARKAKQLPASPNVNIPLKITSFSLYHSYSTPSGVHYSRLKTWYFHSNEANDSNGK